jgi:outer membrane PBP1 activator LpoA protein
MNRHNVILSIFCLFLLSGCASKKIVHRYQYVNESIKAEYYSQSGQHKQAGSLYQALAKTKPARQNEYNLLAAEAYLQSGDSLLAQSVTDSLSPNLTTEQRNKLNLILIQISLSNGETEKALSQLSVTQPHSFNSADQVTYYQSLAFAHSLTGNPLQSVKARIQLTPLLQSTQLHENNKVILDTLLLLPSQTLSLQQAPAPDILSGWMALAKLLKTNKSNQNSAEFQIALSEWRLLFPQHPANTGFLQSYFESTENLKNNFKMPSAIALLLPESGRFAKAAETIREGFMAAYHQSQTGFQPSIRHYDSSTGSSVNLYHQAIAEGAELVIGPLSKNNIQELALETELSVPVLALNHIPNLAKDNLFQFGLSPIDEAKQIASQATSHGIKKVLLLTPDSRKGSRTADDLTEYWQETGGTVLETQHYNTKGGDFSASIKNLLNLDEGQYRYSKLRRLLSRRIEYIGRRRKDVDAIFLSASPQKARSIYPQLQFYRATQVPVYASPQIYSGEPNPSADIDLNGIIFCDIPWLFPDSYPGELSQESMRDSWQNRPSKYLRLIALGIDSFNIIAELDDISSIPYAGATGTLSLDMENRITRQLVCAKFINGRPVLQEPVNTETENDFEL